MWSVIVQKCLRQILHEIEPTEFVILDGHNRLIGNKTGRKRIGEIVGKHENLYFAESDFSSEFNNLDAI